MNVPALFRHLAWPPGGPSSLALPAHSRAETARCGLRPDPSRKSTAQTPVIATQEKKRLGKQEVIRRSRRLEDERKVQFPLERFAHTYVLDSIPLHDVPVLTDDYAPVDGLLHFSAW